MLWRWMKRMFKPNPLKELYKLSVAMEHPDAWPIIWYGPKVAGVLLLTGVGLGLWSFFFVLEHYPDEFWKPVAGAVGAAVASVITLAVRAILQGKK